jgi:hypothetical protein
MDLSLHRKIFKKRKKENVSLNLGRTRWPDPAYPGPALAHETFPSLCRWHAGPARHPYRCVAPHRTRVRAEPAAPHPGRAAAPRPRQTWPACRCVAPLAYLKANAAAPCPLSPNPSRAPRPPPPPPRTLARPPLSIRHLVASPLS